MGGVGIRWGALFFLWASLALAELPPLSCAVDLAGFSLANDSLEKSQFIDEWTTPEGRTVKEYRAETSELGGLNVRLLEALTLANRRFNETRPETRDLVFARQKKVVAAMTRYFVLLGADGAATGMGMLVEGNAGVALPAEAEFPTQNLRVRDGEARRLVELARLAMHEKEKGGLRHVFHAAAHRLLAQYGDPLPSDLDVVLWTSLAGLTTLYRDRYGFAVWRTPEQLGCAECAVLGLSAREFVEKYR